MSFPTVTLTIQSSQSQAPSQATVFAIRPDVSTWTSACSCKIHEDHSNTSALGRSGFNRLFICWSLQWPTLCSPLLVSDFFLMLSPQNASLGFVTNVSDCGFCVIGFSMNFEISYQLFHCALVLLACSWHCSFRILPSMSFSLSSYPCCSLHLCFHQNRFVVVYCSVDSGLLQHHYSAAS